MTHHENTHSAPEVINDQADPRPPRTLGLDLTEENRRYLSSRVNLILDIHRVAPKVVLGLIGLVIAGLSLREFIERLKYLLTTDSGTFTLQYLGNVTPEGYRIYTFLAGGIALGAAIIWLVTRKKQSV